MNKYQEHSKAGSNKQLLHKLHSCEQKRSYESYEEAWEGWRQVVYQCKHCQLWHRSSEVPRLSLGIASRKSKARRGGSFTRIALFTTVVNIKDS